MSLAFTSVTGMFAKPEVGSSSFVSALAPAVSRVRAGAVTMAVDAYQRKFQTYGKINVDYKVPKVPSQFKRGGSGASLVDYPQTASMSGIYPVSYCGQPSGSRAILNKFDEYCSKTILKNYKKSAVPYGYYTPKCTEATTQFGMAEDKRVFSRQTAFRQSQKPINVRLRERYEARKAAFIMTNGCHHEERQFAGMPMTCQTYMAAQSEASGACVRTVVPTSPEENYMAKSIRSQLLQAKFTGVYPVGVCMDGHVKGQAEDRRVAVKSSEYRAAQQDAGTVANQKYAARQLVNKLHFHGCLYEESLFSAFPTVAAAMLRY